MCLKRCTYVNTKRVLGFSEMLWPEYLLAWCTLCMSSRLAKVLKISPKTHHHHSMMKILFLQLCGHKWPQKLTLNLYAQSVE